jgi:hypothetical protein
MPKLLQTQSIYVIKLINNKHYKEDVNISIISNLYVYISWSV